MEEIIKIESASQYNNSRRMGIEDEQINHAKHL
jgi:hypothetical protein